MRPHALTVFTSVLRWMAVLCTAALGMCSPVQPGRTRADPFTELPVEPGRAPFQISELFVGQRVMSAGGASAV